MQPLGESIIRVYRRNLSFEAYDSIQAGTSNDIPYRNFQPLEAIENQKLPEKFSAANA